MKRIALAGIAALTLAVAACGGSSGSSSARPRGAARRDGHDPVLACPDPAHRQGDAAARQLLQRLASAHRRAGELRGTSTGDLLPKVTTALAAGTAPDVAYIYGSYAANIAQSGKTVNLKNIDPHAGIQLERPLPGVAADRVARGQGHRVPRPHRQPVGDLQQEAVRRGLASPLRPPTGPGTSSAPSRRS